MKRVAGVVGSDANSLLRPPVAPPCARGGVGGRSPTGLPHARAVATWAFSPPSTSPSRPSPRSASATSRSPPVDRDPGVRDHPHRHGATLLTTVFALVTNVLVSWSIEQSLGREQLVGMQGHVVVVGLGSVGIRVLEGLQAEGRQAVVVEQNENNRFMNQARARGVPVSSPTPPSVRRWRTPTFTTPRPWPFSPVTTYQHRDRAGRAGLSRGSVDGGAGRAPGLRPRPRPHRGAPLRLPPRAVHLGTGRPSLCRRRSRPRRPGLVHRRSPALPGRSADRGAGAGAGRAGHARPPRPDPGHRPQPGGRRWTARAPTPARHPLRPRAIRPTWSGPTKSCWPSSATSTRGRGPPPCEPANRTGDAVMAEAAVHPQGTGCSCSVHWRFARRSPAMTTVCGGALRSRRATGGAPAGPSHHPDDGGPNHQ